MLNDSVAKKNVSCVTNISDISTKSTPLYSALFLPSSELNSMISSDIIIKISLFGYVTGIHFSAIFVVTLLS